MNSFANACMHIARHCHSMPLEIIGLRYGMYLDNRTQLITAYPCFEADKDSAEPANQYMVTYSYRLFSRMHTPRHTTIVCALPSCLHNATWQSFWRGGYTCMPGLWVSQALGTNVKRGLSRKN